MNINKNFLIGSICFLSLCLGSFVANASGDRNSIEEPAEVVKEPAVNANIAIDTSNLKSFLDAVSSDEETTNKEERNDVIKLNTTAEELSKMRTKINTSIGLNVGGDEKLDSSSETFLKNLQGCIKSDVASKTILGFDENGKCVLKDGTTTCRFPKSKLSQVVTYYRKKLSGSIDGQYNIGLDMKMPEIKIDESSDNNFGFNLKLELPKIKFDKVKTDMDVLIEESCK